MAGWWWGQNWFKLGKKQGDEIWNGLKCHHARHSLLAGVVLIPFILNVRFVWRSFRCAYWWLEHHKLRSIRSVTDTTDSCLCKEQQPGHISCVKIWELVQSIPKSSSHKDTHWHHLILFWLSSSQTKPAIRIVDWLNNQEMKFIAQLSEDMVQ